MNCSNCGGKGFQESWQIGAASWTPSLIQCRHRCNIKGYSDEVQRRLNNPAHVTERPVVQTIDTERKVAPVIRLHFHNAKKAE